MPGRTIQPQDPSASPTFNLSQTNAATVNGSTIPSSLRRNLFSSHLSRRPVAPQHLSSSDTLPDPFQTTPVSFSRQSSQPSYNIFTQPQPALSPTSQQYNPPNYASLPPAVSPKRPLSSTHPQTAAPAPSNTSTSILHLDPTTGRPVLPVLPTLPSRLRLSSDSEDEDEDEPDPDHAHLQEVHHQQDYMQPHNIDFSSSTSAFPAGTSALTGLIDATSDPDYSSYERIERVLSEMQAQQRARARQLPQSTDAVNWGVGNAVSTRSRGKTKAHGLEEASVGGCGGVGATIPQQEKEELLGLIMTSLGRKVALMEEEGWMFGDEGGVAEVASHD